MMGSASNSGVARPGRWWHGYRQRAGLAVLSLLAPVCAFVWFSWPRPLVPLQLPSLSFDRAPVQAALAADKRLAAQVPSSEWIEQLDRSFLDQGRVDFDLGELLDAHQRRRALRLELVAKVEQAHGTEALVALRAQAVERFEALLAGRPVGPDAAEILGSFPNALAAHGVTRGGVDVAPTFVTRTLYKVRWNLVCGLDRAFRFASVESRALFGWEALHAQNLPIPERLASLEAFATAGGKRIEEARGVLLFLNGEFAASEAALRRAQARNPSWRLRNYLLGAEFAARIAAVRGPSGGS